MYAKPKKSRFAGIFIALWVLIFAAVGMAVAGVIWYQRLLRPALIEERLVQTTVEQGESASTVAAGLEKAGLIRSSRAFKLYLKYQKNNPVLKAGEFDISGSWSVQKIVDTLTEGKQKPKFYTITPGLRVDQIKKRMVQNGYLQADVDKAFEISQYSDIKLLSNLPYQNVPLEGLLFPETYSIKDEATPTDIVRAALVQMDKVVDSEMQAKFKARGLSPYQGITLASVVEKEVSGDADRKKVAQIFLSRLDLGISLGSDATYYYASAVFGGEPFPDLDSPYNTRKYSGLPPGPIDNVGLSALKAVADPENSNYLFFVTGDDGVNHFTSTDAEHSAAVKQFCKVSCAVGYIPDQN
jgi:UPF0755 protein